MYLLVNYASNEMVNDLYKPMVADDIYAGTYIRASIR